MRWPWPRTERSDERAPENDPESLGEGNGIESRAIASERIASDESGSEAPLVDDTPPPSTAKEAPAMSEAHSPESPESRPESAPSGLEQRIVESLKTVYDPEIPVDIYELGLIYEVDVRPENSVYVKMTLTSPMCPVAETLPPEVEEKVRLVEGVTNVELELVWDPPWHPDMMSEAAKLTLNM